VTEPRIAVLDYGMGNLRSVEKALERSGARASVTNDHDQIRASDGLILPGVGAFPKAMRNLRELELDAVIAEQLAGGMPMLGICLGMQLLFEASSENEGAWGLGLLGGRVERLSPGGGTQGETAQPSTMLKIPHIGWNTVRWTRRTALVEDLPDECPFYFVHSFAPVTVSGEDVLGTSAYGQPFVCAVEREPVYGVQFHPEKSSAHGLRLLRNFTSICATVGAAS
jgi:glutamine amidotransferase